MKTKILILFAIIVGAHCNVSLHAQELPDTVWTRTFENWIDITCVKFSPDGQYIFAGTFNDILQIETATGEIFRKITGHTGPVYTISFSPTGDTILSMGEDRTIRLWNYATGDSIYSFRYEPKDTSEDIKLGPLGFLTPDGKRIITLTGCYRISGDNYDNVYVFDIGTKELIAGVGDFISAYELAISPDGKYFCLGIYGKTIKLFDLNTYMEIGTLGYLDGAVRSIAFSPDSKMVASSGEDNKVRIWDVETKELLHTLYHEMGQHAYINNIVFSIDSKFLILGEGAGTYNKIQVWNIDEEKKIYEYSNSGFTDIDIRFDDMLIATSSKRLSLLNPKWIVTDIIEPITKGFNYTLKDDILYLTFDEKLIAKPTINIYNILGVAVGANGRSPLQLGNEIEIDLNYLISGVYFVVMDVGGNRRVVKVMK
ncbi:MAG: hypothetical protein V1779_10155 [bacterium]